MASMPFAGSSGTLVANGWTISSAARAQHDRTFFSLGPVNGRLSGEKARQFLVTSRLPNAVLGHIWNLADVDRDGQLTSNEFAMASHLVSCCKAGMEMPKVLPPPLLASANATGMSMSGPTLSVGTVGAGMERNQSAWMGQMAAQPGASLRFGESVLTGQGRLAATSSLPVGGQSPSVGALHRSNTMAYGGHQPSGTTDGDSWAVPQSARFKYNQMFNQNDHSRRGYLTGLEARPLLTRSNLTQPQLAQIWALVDVEGNGRLTCDQFVAAMHLAESVRTGRALPTQLPPELIRGTGLAGGGMQMRRGTVSGAKPESSFQMKGTYEDKKRENFTKGQEFLEKRRQELQDQINKEAEEKLRKQQEEEERKMQEKREQEMRRQQELEIQQRKLLHEQQKLELEQQKAVMQRQAAQREMERKRQEEQIRQRKAELMQQRSRLFEAVNVIKPKARRIVMEVQTLDGQRQELRESLQKQQEQVASTRAFLSSAQGHSGSTAELEQLRAETLRSRQQLSQLSSEREYHSQRLSSIRGAEVVAAYQSTMSTLREAQNRVIALRQTRASNAQLLGAKQAELSRCQSSLQDARSELQRKREEVAVLQRRADEERQQREIANQLEQKRREEERQRLEQKRKAEEARRQDEERRRREEQQRLEQQRRQEAEVQRKREEAEKRRQQEEAEKQRQEQERRDAEAKAKEAEKDPFASTGPSFSWPQQSNSAWPPASNSTSSGTAGGWPSASKDDASKDPFAGLSSATSSSGDAFGGAAWPQQASDNAAEENDFGWSRSSKTKTQQAGAMPVKPSPPVVAKRQAPAVPVARQKPSVTDSAVAQPRPVPQRRKTGTPEFEQEKPKAEQEKPVTGNKEDEVRRRVEELQRKKAELQALKKKRELEAKKTELEAKQPTAAAHSKTTAKTYRAEFEFQGRSSEELTFKEGDLIVATDALGEPEPGWLAGELKGQSGWFPANYVKEIQADSSGQIPSDFMEQAFDNPYGTLGPGAPKASNLPATTPDANSTRAQALYPWRAKKDNHLSFKKGDTIIVKEQQDMWWSGILDGKVGWFPKSYVKLIGGPVRAEENPFESPDATTPQPPADSPLEEEYVALYPYSGQAGDLSFGEGDVIMVTNKDGDWWHGRCGHRTGTFPATYVTSKDSSQVHSTSQVAEDVVLEKPLIGTVVSPYTASGSDGLSLAVGQLVAVHKQCADGWWEGQLQARGKKKQYGRFPSQHVKLLSSPAESAVTKNAVDLKSMDGGSAVDKRAAFSKADSGTVLAGSRNSSSARGEQVVTLFPYQAAKPDELTFAKDDVLTVLEKDGSWWKGELNGTTGYFPSNYVQPVSEHFSGLRPSWSATVPADFLENIAEHERTRQEAIFELINTEQNYVDDLEMVLEIFYKPLVERLIFSDDELEKVFINWRSLLQGNRVFLRALRVRQSGYQNQPVPIIGDILCEQIPRLTGHVRFCSCQLRAASFLNTASVNNERFREFEQERLADGLSGGLPLSSFLLKPLQRVTKYPLLISQIKKNTDADHPDIPNLTEALERAQQLCSQVNEGVRMQENSDRLESLHKNVQMSGLKEYFHFNSNTNCLGPRKLLHDGRLCKAVSGRELHGYLFNDFFLLTKSAAANPFVKALGGDHEEKMIMYRQPFFLNEVLVKEAAVEEFGDDCSFHISHVGKIISLKADSQVDRDRWVAKILEANSVFVKTLREMKQKTMAARKRSQEKGVASLLVHVIEGKDLKAGDPGGKSDPYCQVTVGQEEQRTQVILETLHPRWDHKMLFTLHDHRGEVVCFTIYDHDRFSPDDFLGRTELSIDSLLKSGPGPWKKILLLQGVETGEIKVDLQINTARKV